MPVKQINYFNQLKKKIMPIIVASTVISLLLQLVSLVPIYIMPFIIDKFIPSKNFGFLMWAIVIYVSIPLVTSLGYNVYQYYIALQGRKLVTEINLKCFDKLIHQPMKFFDENYSAEIAKKCSQEANSYICSWTIDIPQLISGGIMGVFVFLLLLKIHPILAFVQLLFFPFVVILMKQMGKKLQILIELVLKNNAKYQKEMQETFRSIRFIKATQLEDEAIGRVKKTQYDTLRIWGKVAFLDNFVSGISSKMLPGIFYGITFALSALLAAKGNITIGALTASLGYATKIHHVFDQLIATYKEHKKAKGEVKAIEEYLNLQDERDNAASEFVEWNFNNNIVYRNVHFKYPRGEREILSGLSLELSKGKWIGITGKSGMGKTTILELLVRFYDISQGQILVDGIDLKKFDLLQLRKNISYVSQDTYLIEGSIRDNLTIVIKDKDEKELTQIAKATGILDYIENGLEKQVGEAGMLLSGGEKQRVAIARCLLEKKEIILLDEATSQLDNDTQEKMACLINDYRLKNHVTIVSIAHRTEFNHYADFVINVNSI